MLGGPARAARVRAPGNRCAVVDAHQAVRAGVVAALLDACGIEVVASSDTIEGVLGHGSDVVLLDLGLTDGSTPTQNTLRLRSDGARVLGFGSGVDPARIREAARAGSHGMVRASEPATELVAAVRAVLRGDVAASTDWAAAVDADPDEDPAPGARTTHEHRVLELVATGMRAERVAAELGLAPAAVRAALLSVRDAYVRPEWRRRDGRGPADLS